MTTVYRVRAEVLVGVDDRPVIAQLNGVEWRESVWSRPTRKTALAWAMALRADPDFYRHVVVEKTDGGPWVPSR
jgi:hypothetical protein